MKPAWHRHLNVRCTKCNVIIWQRITCASKRPVAECPLPKLARCPEHRKKYGLTDTRSDS